MGVDSLDITQVEDMANLMSKLGPTIVILSVFLLLFLVVMIAILKGFIDNQKKTQQQNEALLQTVLDNFEGFKKIEESKRDEKLYDERNIVEIFVKLNRIFKADCKRYSEQLKCDRIGIYVFHNGTTSSHGLPFFKVSCISEYIKRGCGIPTQINNCNSVPLSVFEDVVDVLYSYGFIIIHNSYEDDESPCTNPTHVSSSSFYIEKDKVRIAIGVAVYDSLDNVFAFILAEYLQAIDDKTISANIEIIREFCGRIRPTLEFSEYATIDDGGDV